MIQKIVSDIGGVGVFGVISICLFFTVFSGALIWAACLSSKMLKSMEALPLEDENRNNTKKGGPRE